MDNEDPLASRPVAAPAAGSGEPRKTAVPQQISTTQDAEDVRARAARPGSTLRLPEVERCAISSTVPPAPGDDPRTIALSPDAEAVVTRWNPHGLALLRAMRWDGAAPPRTVALISAGDINSVMLRVELARFEPHVDVEERAAQRNPHDGPVDPGGGAPCCPAAGEAHGTAERPVPVALVVLDAGSPIGGDMLRVVRELWADGTRIVFALDGIHAHREWRMILRQDAELLSALRRELEAAVPPEAEATTAAPQNSPAAAASEVEIVPVSARVAAVARAGSDAALLDRSGLGWLHALLVAAAGAGPEGDQAAIVRDRVVGETRVRIERQLAKLRGGGDVTALREERATLLAVSDGGRGTAMATLRNRMQLARVDLVHEVGSRVRALNAGIRAEIEGLPCTAEADTPERLAGAVEDLTREMDRAVRNRLLELTSQVEQAAGAADWEVAEAAVKAARAVPVRPGSGPERRRRGLEDRLMLLVGASAGFGLGRFVVAPLAVWESFEWAIVPVGLVLGLAVAAWVVRARGQLAERAHLQQWVSDTLVNVKAQSEQRVATALVEAEERLAEEVVGATTERMVETDRRVGELEAQLRQAAHRRPALTAACERDLAVLADR
ncbi:hypothetical protein [Nocardia acididurans]|uniref:hypothetical protein n=1 Tax=Nocardia acididurans TaxID=2802282 RepID=UPI0027DC52E2|nr:hypothetical protein [Nocardia acididurans]